MSILVHLKEVIVVRTSITVYTKYISMWT
jgi:hypothetical protein